MPILKDGLCERCTRINTATKLNVLIAYFHLFHYFLPFYFMSYFATTLNVRCNEATQSFSDWILKSRNMFRYKKRETKSTITNRIEKSNERENFDLTGDEFHLWDTFSLHQSISELDNHVNQSPITLSIFIIVFPSCFHQTLNPFTQLWKTLFWI